MEQTLQELYSRHFADYARTHYLNCDQVSAGHALRLCRTARLVWTCVTL